MVEIRGGDNAVLGPLVPQVPGQGTGIEPMDTDYPVFTQVGAQAHGCPPVGITVLIFLDDEAGQKQAATFDILGIDAGVADLGVGHGDHLPLVGRIGQDLLISGHGGVKDDLATDFARSTKGFTFEDAPIGERKNCFHDFRLQYS